MKIQSWRPYKKLRIRKTGTAELEEVLVLVVGKQLERLGMNFGSPLALLTSPATP